VDLLTSGYEFLVKGGPVMWPLLLASVLAMGAAIERYLLLRGALDGAEDLIEDVSRAVVRGSVDEARGRALRAGGPVGRVMAAGLDHWDAGSAACEKAMEERGMIEREALSKRLVILDTVITVAPLLGLLGTVTGMIKAFEVVGAENQIGSPTAITGHGSVHRHRDPGHLQLSERQGSAGGGYDGDRRNAHCEPAHRAG
jgi:biopolymer transport protein ExbB